MLLIIFQMKCKVIVLYTGVIVRRCLSSLSGPTWDTPNSNGCTNQQISALLDKVRAFRVAHLPSRKFWLVRSMCGLFADWCVQMLVCQVNQVTDGIGDISSSEAESISGVLANLTQVDGTPLRTGDIQLVINILQGLSNIQSLPGRHVSKNQMKVCCLVFKTSLKWFI